MSKETVNILQTERLQPRTPPAADKVVALSLLDATTANFGLTNAIWLFEKSPNSSHDSFHTLAEGLRQALRVTLDSYPWWCGRLKMITTTSGEEKETAHLPAHARRYGRVYVHYGTQAEDPGVEVITATSSATLDSLYPNQRTTKHPIWNGHDTPLGPFIPSSARVDPRQPDELDDDGRRKSPLAIQITGLVCGGWTLAVKSTHPLADITTLITFVKDWALLYRSTLSGESQPQLTRHLEPWKVDDLARGDINSDDPDADTIRAARSLPLHRYDWWHPDAEKTCPWPVDMPEAFQSEHLSPVGKCMPWNEWDVAAPVSNSIVHLTGDQVEVLYTKASPPEDADGSENLQRISRHDAVLAHIWSCIVRARGLQDDDDPVHCDLTYGLRPALKLGESFIGSPIVMLNVELPSRKAGDPVHSLRTAAQKIRETVTSVRPSDVSAHLHDVAYEKTPQRVWQAFLGRRHILVTTWARAGQYDIDFAGQGPGGIRYADGVMPPLDGVILIKEAPPPPTTKSTNTGDRRPWTADGVDVSVHLRREDMERLVADPLLLPALN